MKKIFIKKVFIAFILVIPVAFLYAQQPRRQKQDQRFQGQRQQANKVSSSNMQELKQATEQFWKLKGEFDSVDFEYAILLNDNAGLFAAKQTTDKANFLKMIGHVSAVMNNSNLSNEQIAKVNLELGQASFILGRFAIAGKRLTEASNRFANSSSNENDYLETLSSLALLYTSTGRPKLADSFLLKATSLHENKFGMKGRGLASLLNNRAVLDFTTGRYNKSEYGFIKATELLQSNGLLSSLEYAIVLNNQAMLFQSLGRYEEAKENLLKAIDIAKENKEMSRARKHLKFYTNLALLYQRMNLFDEAEKIYHTLESKYAKGTTEFANLLNNIAILLFIKGQDARVEDMLKNSSLMFKANLGENNIAYAKAINDLGNYYRIKGRYDEATQYLEKAFQIRKNHIGIRHPVFVQNEEDLAILYWKKKEWPKAAIHYRSVLDKTIDFINTYFIAMSEAEKARYWDILSPRFLRAYNFVLEAPQLSKDGLTELLRYRVATKGLLLNSARKITNSILSSGDARLIGDYTDWIDLKEQLASFYVYSNEELKEQNINIDSMEAAANLLEKKLSVGSKDFSNFYFINKANVFAIRSALKADEALIEIIRLQYYDQNFTDSCRYIGLILTKNDPQPKLVIIPNGPALEKTASKNYQQAIKRKTADEQSYKHFWQPYDELVKGKRKIFISLDGVYNQISMNTLKKPGADYLIKQYEFVLLGNPKDILHDNMQTNKTRNATLIGNPDFGSDQIPGLPGTQSEVDSVQRVLKSSGYAVAEFLAKNATETNLKRSGKVLVLHIATHGYFLQDVVKTYWPIGVAEENAKNNVLLRSGLLLAGAADADKVKTGLDSANNGIMTAYEAMNLDLSGTSLVVLSACETGLGEIKAGEGVYGLQRAFLEAGAEALIMSLWKVDDNATQQLMNNFYQNWIKTGDKQKAFRQAQLQLMEKYPAPYYWGAFVMIGN